MDLRFVPSDPMCLASCHILISKQDSTVSALRSNRCVTGRRSRDENHAVRFRESAENRSRARDAQPNWGVSDELARGCKRWHPLAPGRSPLSLSICLSTHLSHNTETSTLSRIKCERYFFYKEVCSFFHWSSSFMFPLVYVCGNITILSSAEMQSVNSTAPADWAKQVLLGRKRS